MTTLSKAEFVDALNKGKGRALLHLREQGDAGLENELMNATIHNLAYDPQSEGSRATWMMELLSHAKEPETYYRAVLAQFPDCIDGRDLSQMAGMLAILAQRDYPGARELLYAKIDRQLLGETGEREYLSGKDIVDLDGIEGFLHVADFIGRRMRRDPDYSTNDYLLTTTGWKHGARKVAAALRRAAKTNLDVKAYADAIIAQSGSLIPDHKSRPPLAPERITLAAFLAGPMDQKVRRRSFEMRFARRATNQELTALLQIIAEENDPVRLRRYLGVFNRTEMPEFSSRVLELARSDDIETRDLAISALALMNGEAVRNLALELLDAGVLAAIALFAKNYVDGDFDRIAEKLGAPDEARRAHDLGMDLLQVCADHPVPEAADCLIWIYQHTPCAFCRCSAVEDLVEIDRLPADMALECRYDCNPDTRDAVAKAA